MTSYNEDFVILACTILIKLQGDRQTSKWTDTSKIAKTRKALRAVAHKKVYKPSENDNQLYLACSTRNDDILYTSQQYCELVQINKTIYPAAHYTVSQKKQSKLFLS